MFRSGVQSPCRLGIEERRSRSVSPATAPTADFPAQSALDDMEVVTDLSARVAAEQEVSSSVLVLSQLVRRTACVEGRRVAADRQVRRRLHLEIRTCSGGFGEDGVALVGGDCAGDPVITEPLVDRALNRARLDHRRAATPEGRLPFVFANAPAGVITHELVGHLLETDIIVSGGTSLAERMGENVCGVPITVVDDPTLAGRWGSFAFDDEGQPSVATPLLRDGVVCGVLTDRARGSVFGAPHCGHNARRASHEYVPLPRMSNLVMRRGEEAVDDVLCDLGFGVYRDGLTRGQIDPNTGRFVLNMTSGRAVRRGKLAESLGPAILTGNVLEALEEIRAVSSDMDDVQTLCGKAGQQVLVEMNSPSILVGGLEVARA